jgi:electron transfer flavoprotein alpha subunit
MSILVIAEHDNKKLRATTLTTLDAARQFNSDIKVLVAGSQCDSVVTDLKQYGFISEVLVADHACFDHQLVEVVAPLIVECASQFTHILAPSTTFGKNVLPRVAALLDIGMVSDVISIVDNKTYKRPIYAGNAIAMVESANDIQLISIRPSAFNMVEAENGEVAVTALQNSFENHFSKFISEEKHGGDRPELASADIVISGGRGVGDKETFEKLIDIADRIGAAVGASRAAVDSGLAPNDFQVGQTGQIVSPKLYIAIGISGAIQHLAGMKDSSVIVAINKDPDAPIFEVADYGLVADLTEILPQWEAMLETAKL